MSNSTAKRPTLSTHLFGGACTLLLGVLGVTGWITGIRAIGSFSPNYIPMAPDTGVTFMLFGGIIVLSAMRTSYSKSRVPAIAVVAIAAIYGLLKFIEYFVGLDLTFENALFPITETLGSFPLKRMSPITGAEFFLSGITLLLAMRSRVGPATQNLIGSLGSLVFVSGSVASIGYVYGTPLLYGGGVIPLAAPTALAFTSLGIGLVSLAGPESFPLRHFSGPSLRSRLMRTFLPLVASAIIVEGLVHEALDRWATVNLAEIAASMAVSFAAIGGALVFLISRSVSRGIEAADEGRRQAEAKLKESESLFRSQFELGNIGIALTSPEKRWIRVNRRLCQMMGYSEEELRKMTWAEVTFPEDLESDIAQLNRVVAGSIDGYELDKRFVRKDGAVFWTHLAVSCVRKADRSVLYFIASMLDISEHKALEHLLQGSLNRETKTAQEWQETLRRLREGARVFASGDLNYRIDIKTGNEAEELADAFNVTAARLQESLGQFRTIVETMLNGLSIYDNNRRLTMVNKRLADMLGYAPEEMVGRDLLFMVAEPNRKEVEDNISQRLSGKARTYETCVVDKSGQLVPVLVAGSPRWGPDGKVVGGFAVIADLRQIKNLQEQNAKAEKMASLGQITAIVAHELRNPLATISNTIYYLKMHLGKEDKKLLWHMKAASRAVASCARVIEDLLDYTRPKQPTLSPIPLNSLVENALGRIEVDDNITVARKFTPDMPLLNVDAEMMRRIFMNIITNAIQAMPQGGALTLSTRSDGQWQEVEITDTGKGIDPEVQSKLFQPLFSTKAKGTGLGLYISQQTVSQHGGTIALTSQVGVGTTVTIRLPVERMA